MSTLVDPAVQAQIGARFATLLARHGDALLREPRVAAMDPHQFEVWAELALRADHATGRVGEPYDKSVNHRVAMNDLFRWLMREAGWRQETRRDKLALAIRRKAFVELANVRPMGLVWAVGGAFFVAPLWLEGRDG